MPLKVFSQDAEVSLLCNIPREDAEQEEEEEEMAASQVREAMNTPVPGLGLCLLFLLKCLD